MSSRKHGALHRGVAIVAGLYVVAASALWLLVPLWFLLTGGALGCSPVASGGGYRAVGGPDAGSDLVSTFWLLLIYGAIFGGPGYGAIVHGVRMVFVPARGFEGRIALVSINYAVLACIPASCVFSHLLFLWLSLGNLDMGSVFFSTPVIVTMVPLAPILWAFAWALIYGNLAAKKFREQGAS